MKDKDQIAAEAAGAIVQYAATQRGVLLNEFSVTDIIKSAIEKAYREGWRVGRDFAVAGQRDTATATQSNPAQHTGGRENE